MESARAHLRDRKKYGCLTEMGSTIIRIITGVSDREAENRARYDLRWKLALGISIAESGFNYSALSRFRARLLLHKKERTAFEEILDAAISKGLLPGNCAKQIMDSTYVLGAGAVQDTYTLIRMAIRKLLIFRRNCTILPFP